MSKDESEEETKDEGPFLDDYYVVHDSIGVSHWLPRRWCKDCDD